MNFESEELIRDPRAKTDWFRTERSGPRTEPGAGNLKKFRTSSDQGNFQNLGPDQDSEKITNLAPDRTNKNLNISDRVGPELVVRGSL